MRVEWHKNNWFYQMIFHSAQEMTEKDDDFCKPFPHENHYFALYLHIESLGPCESQEPVFRFINRNKHL